MWPEIVEYLKDASLVAEIQKYFGVNIHYAETLKENADDEFCQKKREGYARNINDDLNSCQLAYRESKENGYITNERKNIANTDACTQTNAQTSIASHSNYTITNYFWYYLFLFGTELGDEIFYSTFIPFWFWNIDGAVGRRVVLVWSISMTIGQMLKDVICWPRPACPPAIRLQSKWSDEYGMPSTHAMNGIVIPFSVVFYTMRRYIYPVYIGWVIAILWCTLVCMSRLYLGMHTVLDIVAGLILAIALMIPLIPLVDFTDYYIFSSSWGIGTLIAISIGVIVYYPGKKWTPTRGDTTMVVSVTTGVHLGAWLNYKSGTMLAPTTLPPYEIIWPTHKMFGCMLLRTILGLCGILAIRTVCKSLSYRIVCAILNIEVKDLVRSKNFVGDRNKILVDLVQKYITCFMIGVNTVYVFQHFFILLGIERPTFYTEI